MSGRVHVCCSICDDHAFGTQKYFAKWGQQGTVDLKQELEQLLMLISARCLLGKEVREKMFDEVFSAFHELTENSLQLTSLLFPYAPTLTTRRRDRASARLSSIFAEIVRSRKSSNRVEEDVLQNLIGSKYKDGRPTTEAEVTGLIMAILFAGKHTSTATSTWTGARLLSHTECLEAALAAANRQETWGQHRLRYPSRDELPTLLHQGGAADAPSSTNIS